MTSVTPVTQPMSVPLVEPSPILLVVSRFRVPVADRSGFDRDARVALALLAAQPGCLAASLGQSTDEADLVVLRTEWAGVGAYRRGLSSFDVKVGAVPLLSLAIDEPSAYELVVTADADGVREERSGLAADALVVRLGEASEPAVDAVGDGGRS